MGQKIRLLRLQNGRMTQADLSEKSGVSRTTISHIENDKKELTIKVAKKIASVFEIDYLELFKD